MKIEVCYRNENGYVRTVCDDLLNKDYVQAYTSTFVALPQGIDIKSADIAWIRAYTPVKRTRKPKSK